MSSVSQDTPADARREATLVARPLGIDTYLEPIIYMRADCPVCRAEGFESQSRVHVDGDSASLIATLNVVHGNLLAHGEAGLSEAAWALLRATEPCPIRLSHPAPVESFRYVRGKLFGHSFSNSQIDSIIHDVTNRRYSDVQLSAFLASCAGARMQDEEVVALTRAMVDVGDRIDWGIPAVFDKHCVGGLPGNRTTPIVVSIVTALGLVMPKTSSRAITSPAGTADTMEMLTRVDLSLDKMRAVVEREGGCLTWGGSVNLSPADDVLIRIERALDLDSEAQLVASVLSKKIAAGSTHVVIDVPVGNTAKVRNDEGADRIATNLAKTGRMLGLTVKVIRSDGSQPVGRGIGPALEAVDVLKVLQGKADAPRDLRDRSATLAGAVLELSGLAAAGKGKEQAEAALGDGRAWRKFQAICEAQDGLRTPPVADCRYEVTADNAGYLAAIDNLRLAKVAKLAGAPAAPAAGIELLVRLGEHVDSGRVIMIVHAEAPGELEYALDYMRQQPDIFRIDRDRAFAP